MNTIFSNLLTKVTQVHDSMRPCSNKNDTPGYFMKVDVVIKWQNFA